MGEETEMTDPQRTKDESDVLDRAWKDFFAAWCALRALVEEGGATIKMDIRVKAAKQEKRS